MAKRKIFAIWEYQVANDLQRSKDKLEPLYNEEQTIRVKLNVFRVFAKDAPLYDVSEHLIRAEMEKLRCKDETIRDKIHQTREMITYHKNLLRVINQAKNH